jgi:hypothetical protein
MARTAYVDFPQKTTLKDAMRRLNRAFGTKSIYGYRDLAFICAPCSVFLNGGCMHLVGGRVIPIVFQAKVDEFVDVDDSDLEAQEVVEFLRYLRVVVPFCAPNAINVRSEKKLTPKLFRAQLTHASKEVVELARIFDEHKASDLLPPFHDESFQVVRDKVKVCERTIRGGEP